MNETIKPSILVVDDERTQRGTICNILTDHGYPTETAESGKSAINKVIKESFALVVVDIKLGDVSGVEVLKKVKAVHPQTECIVITAHASQNSAIEALNSGAFAYLEKPINAEELLLITKRALQKRTAARELEQLKTFHEDIVQTMGEGVAFEDGEGYFTYLNPAACDLLGYTQEELLGKHWTTVIPPGQREIARKAFQGENKTGSSRHEIAVRRKDGRSIHTIISVTPRYKDGEFAGNLAVFTDITDQMKAKQRMRLQSTALQEAANAILITDRRGTIQWINPAFTDLTGYTKEETLGSNPRILKSGNQNPMFYSEMWQTITQGKTWQGRLINRKKDGSLYIDEQTITPVKDGMGKVTHFVAIKQDVTEQTRAKHVLKQQLNELGVLNSLAMSVSEERNKDELISRAVQILSKNMYPDHVEVLLLDERQDILRTHPSYCGLEIEEGLLTVPVGEGIVGRVAQDGKPRRVYDVARAEHYLEVNPQIRSELCVPIKSGGKVLGVINVEDKEYNAFSEGDQRLLTTFAGQLGPALERLALFEETRKQAKKLAVLYRAALVISRQLDPELMMAHVYDEAKKLFVSDAFLIATLEPDGEEITVSIAFEEEERLSDVEGRRLHIDDKQELISWVVRERSSLLVNDMEEDSLPVAPDQEGKGFRSWLGVPMIVGKKTVGALSLKGFQPQAFDRSDQQVLELLANLVGVSLENARLFTSTNKQAAHMSLVNEVARKALMKLAPGDLLQEAADLLLELFYFHDVMIFLVDQDKKQPVHVAWAGNQERDVERDTSRALSQEGVLSRSIAHGETILVNNVNQEEGYIEVIPETKSELCVPLMENGDVIGGINVESTLKDAFDQTDVVALETLADSLAAGLRTARLFGQVRDRVEQMKALRNIDRTISSSLDINLMLDVLLQEVRSQLEVDAADVLLYDETAQVLEYAASAGFKSRSVEGVKLKLGEGYGGRAVSRRKLVHYPDLKELDPDETRPLSFVGLEGFRGYAAMPLIAKGEVEGVLEVYHRSPLHPDTDWFNFLKTLSTQAAIAIDHVNLFDELQQSNVELTQSYEKMLEGWASALELRDQETQGHSSRVTKLTTQLAEKMGVSPEEKKHIRWGSLLHDVGKMGIPDRILQKPEDLTDREWKVMKRHPEFAYELLSTMEYLEPALDIPYSHHEKWDGTGYPRGLEGKEIPLAARIFAVVDVWDALRSDRPYRQAWSDEEALEYIKSESGKHFDPQVVEAFLELLRNEYGIREKTHSSA